MMLAARAMRLALPVRGYLPTTDFVRIRRSAPFTPGSARLLDKQVQYSDGNGFIHSVGEIFRDQIYRFNAKREDPYIIDAGANIGLSVLYFKQLYPHARIVAYEPDEAIFTLLRENVGAMAGVELRKAAAWTEETVLTFYSEGSLAGSTEIDFLNKGKAVEVKAERLKDRLIDERVDFLKIDIEGAENSVLFDIEDALPNVDHLFFEYHSSPGKTQRLGEMLDLVRAAGFRYVVNGTHGPNLPYVEKVSHGFDLQLNVLCFREETGQDG